MFVYLKMTVLPDCWDLQDVPLHAHVELGQVDPEVHHVGAFNLAHVAEINLNEKVYIDSIKRGRERIFLQQIIGTFQ